MPVHQITTYNIFTTNERYESSQDNKVISIPRVMTSVEITLSLNPPADTNLPGYLPPLSPEQIAVFKTRPYGGRPRYGQRFTPRQQQPAEPHQPVQHVERKDDTPQQPRQEGPRSDYRRQYGQRQNYGYRYQDYRRDDRYSYNPYHRPNDRYNYYGEQNNFFRRPQQQRPYY